VQWYVIRNPTTIVIIQAPCHSVELVCFALSECNSFISDITITKLIYVGPG